MSRDDEINRRLNEIVPTRLEMLGALVVIMIVVMVVESVLIATYITLSEHW